MDSLLDWNYEAETLDVNPQRAHSLFDNNELTNAELKNIKEESAQYSLQAIGLVINSLNKTVIIGRYRQRRDRTHQLVAQLSTLNTRQNLNPTEVCLLGRTLSKDDIRNYCKFETLATTICDQ
jgi:hypothetical protein